MGYKLTISQLEGLINRCKVAEPFSNGVLPPDMRLMATLYGEMIFRHLATVEVEAQQVSLQTVLMKWARVVDAGAGQDTGPVCAVRPGDADFSSCEACQ